MTEEERRNRNPKPEVHPFDFAASPEIPLDTLEYGHVYVLETPKSIMSMNFMGKLQVQDTNLALVTAYHFYAPRVDFNVMLTAHPDGGGLTDTSGNKIKVRKFSGPDA